MRTKTHNIKNFHPETPYNGAIIMPSPEPLYRPKPYLPPATDAFKESHASIMGPPPAPSPSLLREGKKPSSLNPTTTASTANTAAFTRHTIYTTLLKEHQDEILRLTEELVAVKRDREELKAKLAAAEALNVSSPIAKRKKLGGC